MSDEELRELERRFRTTSAHADEVAWLVARVRAATVAPERLHAAALLGHSPAMEACGVAASTVPVAGDLGVEWEDWVEPPEYAWWDPRDWFRGPLTLPSSHPAPHVGQWVRGAVGDLRDSSQREEVALLLAASGLLSASGRDAEAPALIAAARSLDRYDWAEPASVARGPASAATADLLRLADEALVFHGSIRRHLQAGDRPAALEAATELELVRRRLSNSVRDRAVELHPELEAAQRAIRGGVVPWLLG